MYISCERWHEQLKHFDEGGVFLNYLMTFLEGIGSFISPCMLPMLPIYLSYFAGQQLGEEKHSVRQTLPRIVAFILGFTVVFTALGLFAGTLGIYLMMHRTVFNIVCGVSVIIFGLSCMDVIHLPFFKGMNGDHRITSVFSAFLFGAIYSLNLTPCVGAFLGSALMMASTSGSALTGASLLLVYSLGLGIPFLLSAVLLDRLGGAFRWIKRHYKVINRVCGIFLIVIGILMATGHLNDFMSIFS